MKKTGLSQSKHNLFVEKRQEVFLELFHMVKYDILWAWLVCQLYTVECVTHLCPVFVWYLNFLKSVSSWIQKCIPVTVLGHTRSIHTVFQAIINTFLGNSLQYFFHCFFNLLICWTSLGDSCYVFFHIFLVHSGDDGLILMLMEDPYIYWEDVSFRWHKGWYCIYTIYHVTLL